MNDLAAQITNMIVDFYRLNPTTAWFGTIFSMVLGFLSITKQVIMKKGIEQPEENLADEQTEE